MSDQKVMGKREPVGAPTVSDKPEGVKPLAGRWRNIGRREWWGYGVWFLVALVIAIPEISAAWRKVPWPTISGTVGHLEYRWSWVALIVVALVVSAGFHAVRYPLKPKAEPALEANGRKLRTLNGRLTRLKAIEEVAAATRRVAPADRLSVLWFVAAVVIVVVASLITALLIRPANPFMLAYVLYGLIGVLFVLTPSVLAYYFRKDVSFPTLFWTLTAIEYRVHLVAVGVYAGLVILLLHLAFYPWPGIFHVLQPRTPPTVLSP